MTKTPHPISTFTTFSHSSKPRPFSPFAALPDRREGPLCRELLDLRRHLWNHVLDGLAGNKNTRLAAKKLKEAILL